MVSSAEMAYDKALKQNLQQTVNKNQIGGIQTGFNRVLMQKVSD